MRWQEAGLKTRSAAAAIWSYESKIRNVTWIPPIPRGCAHSDHGYVREGVAAISERLNSTTRHSSFPLLTGGLPTKLLAPAAVSVTFVLFQDVPAYEACAKPREASCIRRNVELCWELTA